MFQVADDYIGLDVLSSQMDVKVSNFRRVPGIPVYGMAQPSREVQRETARGRERECERERRGGRERSNFRCVPDIPVYGMAQPSREVHRER